MPENRQTKSQFPELEEKVLSFWETNKIFAKSINKEAPKKDYVFYDGPPFATGTPHYGHIVASLMKDVVPRFWTMQGFRVERRWGWDCHGLPIENIVEKELGSKSKKDIEALGVAKFNELCRSKVLGYATDWEKTVTRLGRWVDFAHGYKTMDLDYMESVWWVFKTLWDKGLIYEGYRSMHICPRCETTLSQSEVAEGYKDIKDLSCIAKFKIDPSSITPTNTNFYKYTNSNIYVLAWTTTPWTLIGNVALAVGKDIDYVLLSCHPGEGRDPEKYIVAKNRIAEIFKDAEYEIEKEFKGSELVGLKYEPLFDYYAKDANLTNKENGWQIYNADFVTTEEGTGVVHIAPAFGEDDLNLGKEQNLPFIQHVGLDGVIKAEAGDFAGMSVKPIDDHTKTDVEIIKYLAHKNLLFAKEKYEHSYPHCWRCDTPLLNYATGSYFVKVTDIKERALKTAEDIKWSPEHIKEGRFGQWLNGARDWSISRQRFWASVLPIWICACGEKKVIGSVKELAELSGQTITDIHKHIVDEIKFPCAKCGADMHRVPDVLDTWFDSGSMPYAQMHYDFENKEKFEANFPAEFIAEGVDQTRAWFYYLHIIANGLFGRPAFKNVIVNGIVLAEDGKKMSKKLQNYPDPNEVLDHYGADALRAYLLSGPVMQAENLNFSEKGVAESLRKNIMILWNVYQFYEMYAQEVESYKVRKVESKNILDLWILARLNELIDGVSEAMNDYNLPKAVRPISVFIDDLSTWYLRRSRERFKSDDQVEKAQALITSRFILLELSKVMAPFMPFIAETIWQKVSGYNFNNKDKSVHLELWPKLKDFSDEFILDNSKMMLTLVHMPIARKAVELILAERDKAGLKVRQPLAGVLIKNCALQRDYFSLIADEVNVKEVECQFGDGELAIELDTTISAELAAEGIIRELTRATNNLRKRVGLNINDRTKAFIDPKDNQKIIETITLYKTDYMSATGTFSLVIDVVPDTVLIKETVDVNGVLIEVGLKK